MSESNGVRVGHSVPASSRDPQSATVERKGRAPSQPSPQPAPRPEAERTPFAARLNGRPVRVLLQPSGAAPVREEKAGACRQVMRTAVQAFWSSTPWAQPERLADDGAAHYGALARRLVGSPPTSVQLQSFVKAVMAREAEHGFLRPPLAEMRAAYAVLAEVLALASADAATLGPVIDALHAAQVSWQHLLGAAEGLARAIGAHRLGAGHLEQLLRVEEPGTYRHRDGRRTSLAMLCDVLGGPRMQDAQLQALVRSILSPARMGLLFEVAREAEFDALVGGLGTHSQVEVPGRLWGRRRVMRADALPQAQVTRLVRAVLGQWQPDADTLAQALRTAIHALHTRQPAAARPQVDGWIAQALVRHFLDPRSLAAGVPWLAGKTEVKQTHDVTATGCLGLAADLVTGMTSDDDAYLGLVRTHLLEPTLRASARLPAPRLRVMARYQFSTSLSRLDMRVAGERYRPLPTRALVDPVLAQVGRLGLQQAGAWLGGVFGGIVRLRPMKLSIPMERQVQLWLADQAMDLGYMAQLLDDMLAASAKEARLSRLALVGYEAGCYALSSGSYEICADRLRRLLRQLAAQRGKLTDDRMVAVLAGLAMAALRRVPDPQKVGQMLVEGIPGASTVPTMPPSGSSSSSRSSPPLRDFAAQVRDALALASQPERMPSDPRFAQGDDAVEMLLLAHAMPIPSGGDDLNRAVDSLAGLQVPQGVKRQVLARVASQRAIELTPANFARVHETMLALLLEASAPPAGAKTGAQADGKREVLGLDEGEAEDPLRFDPAEPLLQFYEELRECSGLMFVYALDDIDAAQLRAHEPALRHMQALVKQALADVGQRLRPDGWSQTRALLEGALRKILQPLEAARDQLDAAQSRAGANAGSSASRSSNTKQLPR